MTISSETQDGVTTISICRPEVRNAVDPDTARALFEAFLAFDADPDARVAVLTGQGGYFCAGFDLKSAGSGAADAWIAGLDIPEGWSDPLADPLPGPMGPSRLMLRKPVIAAIEGTAVAGGLELAAWCDLRVMADDATAGVFCRRWGVPLIDGGTVRLPRILGQGRANDLILTGRPVQASEALSMGLASRVCAPGVALEVAQALAADLVRYPQACMLADHLSARMAPAELAAALKREWQSRASFVAEGRDGAARFAAGKGRGGDFANI
ncbi:crotonase/enoyl-CoA hydratase family protein [Phaeobacter gallaeciensis]|uniref:crotonase/enoyl-CoA hydratase family protein n=1 Tax=Phaeobacter gallaeciensis TaxID=60890 RepID=UPI00237FAD32|nr:crotonase/enoyl-CoA hydratase family protein [Phaeobacter gallaeciensis]MDE4190830.1 crotonase/enoyl-CoA hydratase family protein [Phaeobacter gallaeciensis]MDE4199296.1 crotonase/enoyl-CoA hydratase family protein [Phaeobacter gallaeciensis]MDE4203444.1 crotonase/enoyl-CoA hydratase family protein [Phaeobacter gallaeciensis]MDE4207586.1 crotonase/enoyl-CoA hydratase family protein [Phaeobacter gallaeciensis]MDE4215953.1 crotonase/enoyl-CoA hydratase family protein [Phaeobacter gallaeciensi